MIKAIIFDMDGLMINSEVVTFECYQEVLKEMNLTISREFYLTLLGNTIARTTKCLNLEYGNDFPVVDVINKVHDRMANRFKVEGIPLKTGLIELLTYLKENNYKTIVATSSSRARVDQILHQAELTQYFDDLICGDEVVNGKPNPEIFVKACGKLGVHTDEALVLEDSEAGIQAAYSGNIQVICIPDMKYPVPEFEEKATCVVKSLNDIIDYMKEN